VEFEQLWPILILAVAISVDGFSVGITYGIRQIRIGNLPLLIIGLISTLAIYLTGSLGAKIASLISKELASKIGSLILIGVGSWLIYSVLIEYNHSGGYSDTSIAAADSETDINNEQLLLSLKVKPLGIVIRILKEPVKADFDNSGNISPVEALFLGLALALDALGAGLGAGLTGFPTLLVAMVIGIANLIFVGCGFFIGEKIGDILPEHFEVLPGFIIILLGLVKLI